MKNEFTEPGDIRLAGFHCHTQRCLSAFFVLDIEIDAWIVRKEGCSFQRFGVDAHVKSRASGRLFRGINVSTVLKRRMTSSTFNIVR